MGVYAMKDRWYQVINAGTSEIVVTNYGDSASLTIQSKARGYDDYHVNQAHATLSAEALDHTIAALLPEGSVVLNQSDVDTLLLCEGYIPLRNAVVDPKMLTFSRVWDKIKKSKEDADVR